MLVPVVFTQGADNYIYRFVGRLVQAAFDKHANTL